jgi:hypothetical protein
MEVEGHDLVVSILAPALAGPFVPGSAERQPQEATGTFRREPSPIQPSLREPLRADSQEPHAADFMATVAQRYGHFVSPALAASNCLEECARRNRKGIPMRARSSHHRGPVIRTGRVRDRLAERFCEPGNPTHRVLALLEPELALPRKIDDPTRSPCSHVGVLLVHFRRT